MAKFANISDFESYAAEKVKASEAGGTYLSICSGTGCIANASDKVLEALKEEISNAGLDVEVKSTGCPGFCEQGPLVSVMPEGWLYTQVKVDDVPTIVSESVKGKKVVDDLVFVDPASGDKIPKADDVPFYAKQKRILLANQDKIDPKSIDDYISVGGYKAAVKALSSMEPAAVVEEVKNSGLRGRGGAGFPTGIKWGLVREQENETRYIICNADEGDPGAFMDRALLEGNPHAILEGMIIGAFAMGAAEGYLYVREEYPLAVENVGIAIEQAKKLGLLGENILGTGFDLELYVYKGAGAFVCGEETALMNSIMGKPGVPRQRPPFPAASGLWDCPTNINNVETWANIPQIINNGADWFSAIGTEDSKGTKIFSLVGKIRNTGLVEVPMGITLNEVIFEIGGGIPNDKKFKAVQNGGPSGGCLPEDQLHLPIDYKSLTEAGSIMGSGGMIVMDEDSCMVDIAKYFTEFTLNESCGKCTSCREGLASVADILTDITEGRGTTDQVELLEEVGDYIAGTSMCGLGQTAPNPIRSTLRYFKDEYMAHVNERRCPAHVCKELISYSIDKEKCIGCQRCFKNCPSDAITGEPKGPHIIDDEKCIRCGRCFEECPKKVQAVGKVDRYTGVNA